MYQTACAGGQVTVGCGNIISTPAQKINFAPGNDPDAASIICVKRSTGTSFIKTATNMKADGTCMKGNLCGGEGQKDGLYSMCLEGDTCPITNIVIEPAAYTNATYTKVGDLQTGGVYITREGGNLPLAELLASINSVCANNNDLPYFGGSREHLLLRNKKEEPDVQYECEGGTDESFVPIVRTD